MPKEQTTLSEQRDEKLAVFWDEVTRSPEFELIQAHIRRKLGIDSPTGGGGGNAKYLLGVEDGKKMVLARYRDPFGLVEARSTEPERFPQSPDPDLPRPDGWDSVFR